VKSILRKASVQKGSLLDVGCATGDFLQAFHAISDWDVMGLEIVPEAAAAARAKGLSIIEKKLEDANLEAGTFDVITLWDVLEHMPDPTQILKICYDVLKPGGMLVIKCPDPAGKEAALFKESWIGYEAPQHLFGFPKMVLVNKLRGIGFESVTTSQTGSDYSAFFVSFGHWLKQRGRISLSKFIIRATRKPLGRILAGILVRPFRWLGIRSSCTYYVQKPC
jgi:SAM-dependent methyltransferase